VKKAYMEEIKSVEISEKERLDKAREREKNRVVSGGGW
jgi:hypothetical protein